MITKVEGREFKTKRRVKGWAGWAPVSEAEKAEFQELVLRPRCDRGESDPRDIEEGDGLVLLHDKLVATAAEIKATKTSSRNRNTFCVLEEIRQMTFDAAKSRDPVRRRHLRKIAQKARREFEAGLARGKVINRPVITKVWVNGRACEDRDEWTEEVRAHCGRCCDDEAETSDVQAERIRRQRISGVRRVALLGLRSRWTSFCGNRVRF